MPPTATIKSLPAAFAMMKAMQAEDVEWGESYGPARPNAAVVEAMKPLLIGVDALASETIWERLYAAFRGPRALRGGLTPHRGRCPCSRRPRANEAALPAPLDRARAAGLHRHHLAAPGKRPAGGDRPREQNQRRQR